MVNPPSPNRDYGHLRTRIMMAIDEGKKVGEQGTAANGRKTPINPQLADFHKA